MFVLFDEKENEYNRLSLHRLTVIIAVNTSECRVEFRYEGPRRHSPVSITNSQSRQHAGGHCKVSTQLGFFSK